MSPEEFRAAGHQAVDWIAEYLRDVRDYPVLAQTAPGALTASLPASAPERGESMEAIFADFQKLILPGITHWNHPRFFAYFSISGSGPGILGEMLAAALNVNHMLWKTSPAATELEQVTLGWLRQWLGLPDDFFGIIHDTASTSTMHAILAAREAAAPGARLTGEFPPLVLYTSEHANSSVDKAALAVGVGLSHIRHVPTDEQFRMRPDALAGMIGEDLAAGRKPFCVVPTVGTTSTSSIDPVAAVGEIARRFGLWMHVDAAYAGPAAVLDEFRYILDGAAEADSLVVNPHKWLFTPVDFERAVSAASRGDASRGIPGRNSALFGVLDCSGHRRPSSEPDRVQRAVGPALPLTQAVVRAALLRTRRHCAGAAGAHPLGRRTRPRLILARSRRFEIAAPTLFSLVCFRYRGSDDQNRLLLDRINATGRAFLSGTQLHGRFVLRLAIGNLGTDRADVMETWELIRSLAPAD